MSEEYLSTWTCPECKSEYKENEIPFCAKRLYTLHDKLPFSSKSECDFGLDPPTGLMPPIEWIETTNDLKGEHER